MTKTNEDKTIVSRRKALGRLGLLAATAYTVPALTTLSMAHAKSGSSGPSSSGPSSSGPSSSGPSVSGPSSSGPSVSGPSVSGPSSSGPSTITSPSRALEMCGEPNPGDAAYEQCLIDNGLV